MSTSIQATTSLTISAMRVALISTESRAAIVSVLLGLCVSIIIAPKSSYFFSNLLFYWGSQLGILALILLLKPRLAIVAGTAIVLATYLAAFNFWVFTRAHPDSMAWLGYAFSLPGALLGAIGVVIYLRKKPTLRPLTAGFIAVGFVFVGICINQTIVCNTVLYCLGS